MDVPATVRLDDLLAHREWVRALACALTRDENEADDVAQETWLAALRSRPTGPEGARGWLAAVARNAARRRHRTRVRSALRDAAVARPEHTSCADPADVAARAELHVRVAAAVVALDEPYRGAVLLRHFEGLPVARVAERLGVPLETARARLRRGRAALRARLEREIGGAGGLASALLPLTRDAQVGAGASAAAAAAGGVLMTSKSISAAVALLCAVGGAAWWLQSDDPGPLAQPADTTSTPPADVARAHVDAASAADAGTARRHAGSSAPAMPPGEEAAAARVVVPIDRLLDAALDYDFAVEHATLRRTLGLLAERTQIPIVVDARLSGQLDSSAVTLSVDAGLSARRVLELVVTLQGDALAIESERLVVHAEGVAWEPGREVIVIAPVEPTPRESAVLRIHGRVLGSDGLPVADARILVNGAQRARSDANGAYEVEVARSSVRLAATAALRLTTPPVEVHGELGSDAECDLLVGGPAGALEVRVLGGSPPSPLPGASVAVSWEQSSLGGGEVRLRTDDDGRARPDTLPAGALTVRVAARSHAPETRAVQVVLGETASLEVTLRAAELEERLREIRVSCRFADAAPREVIGYLRSTTHVPVAIAPDCVQALEATRVSIDLADATLERALTDLCAAAGDVEFVVQRGIVLLRARRR